MDPSSYCIYFQARSGSTYLCHLLNTNPSLATLGELFNPGGIGYTTSHEQTLLIRKTAKTLFGEALEEIRAKTSQSEFLDYALRLAGNVFPNQLPGYKVHLHSEHPIDERIVADPATAVIFLMRENTLHAYTSLEIFKKTRVAHVTDKKEYAHTGVNQRKDHRPPTSPFLQFSPHHFENYVRALSDRTAYLKDKLQKNKKRFLELTYEGMSRSVPATIPKYLDVPSEFHPESVPLKKISNINPATLYTNQEELIAYFEDIGKRHWLSAIGPQK